MDTLRRFRSRRKSKGQRDAFTSFADAESSYRSGSSDWQPSTTRSSTTTPRPSDITNDDKSTHNQPQLLKSPTEYRRPGSSSRIQPMLVGISRPSTTNSRPGTAGSMQIALDRAAEAVKQQQIRSTSSPFSQVGLRAGRYIDIFAISGQATKPTGTFNEDVAERNLDSVTLTVEEQHFQYEPTSKYQEEVAARNAHQIAAQRASSMRRPETTDRVKRVEDHIASGQSGSYVHQSLLKPDMARSRHDPDPTAYHSRQHSSRTRDASQQLPAIPQERSSEDFGLLVKKDLHAVRAAEMDLERAKAQWLEARKKHRDDSQLDTDKPLPASPRQKDLSRHLGIAPYANALAYTPDRAEQKATRSSKHDSRQDDKSSSPHVSNPQPNEAAPRRALHASRSQRRDEAIGGRRESDNTRSPSSNSNVSYKRVVGKRTVMDLTHEDEDEAASVASYLQTPVIENARADAFHRVVPEVIENFTPPRVLDWDSTNQILHRSSTPEPVLDLDQLIRRSQIMSETAKAAAVAQGQQVLAQRKEPSRTPPAPALAFSPIKTLTSSSPPTTVAFSPITTLTSTSPRSSQEISAEADLVAGAGVISQDATALSVPGNDFQNSATHHGPRSEARISASISPLVRIFADVKPEDSEVTKMSASGRSRSIRTNSDRRKEKEINMSSKMEGKRLERSVESQIRSAAKSIIPAGPLDQEPLVGVKTRDFAMVPIEKPTNKRIEALVEKKRTQMDSRKSSKEPSSSSKSSSGEKKGRSRSTKSANKAVLSDDAMSSATLPRKPEKRGDKKSNKKSAKSNSSATRKARPISLFDEEAFERKHAEANAALLRLQQSLQAPLESEVEQSFSTRDTTTPASRALSPVDSIGGGLSPPPETTPAAAAIAMINAATSSPRSRLRRLHSKASSDSAQKSRSTKPTPVPRSNTEETLPTLRTTPLSATNPVLARTESSSRPPPSPGEVSLSSFPIPTPRAISPESNKSPPAYAKDVGAPERTGSQASKISSASTFSIPFTMVPDRVGSLPEYRMGVPAPPAPPPIGSIDSIIPSTRPVEVGSP